jgi:hypothetical protein
MIPGGLMGLTRLSLVALVALSIMGCRGQDAELAPPPESETRAPDPKKDPEPVSRLEEVVTSQPPGALPQAGVEETRGESGPEPPPTEVVPNEVITELLVRATTRQQCNRVMGCNAGDELIQLGTGAVGAIMDRYREMPGWSYQRIHLLELLGRIGAAEAVELLVEQLEAPSWDARAQAAIALGRIGAEDQLDLLRNILSGVSERDRGFQYALAFSVEKLGGIGGKELLVAGLEGDRVANTNWGYTLVAAAAVGELGVGEACPLLVHSLQHRDIFLVKAALASAAALGCKELEADIKKLLDAPVPSVRREAERALAAISLR